MQARDLKREPFDIEIKAEVGKVWAAIQEEAAEKTPQKNAAIVTNAVTQTTLEMQKRIEELENFVRKWQPHFEECLQQNPGQKEIEVGAEEVLSIVPSKTQKALL